MMHDITGFGKKVVPRLREFCSFSCLPLLPGLACRILATWETPFCRALYTVCTSLLSSQNARKDGVVHSTGRVPGLAVGRTDLKRRKIQGV